MANTNPSRARLGRRAAAVLLALLLALPMGALTTKVSFAAPETTAEADYVFDTDTQAIVGYLGSSTKPEIPATIGGITVLGIGNQAFKSKNLTEVGIPASVTAIGDSAFQDNQLTSVTLPASAAIGEYAFAFNKLTSITLPSSMPASGLGSFAFRGNEITAITWPTTSGLQLGEGAFMDNRLETLTLPTNITGIGDSAFEANDLTEVNVPTQVTSYGERVFADNGCYVVVTGNNPRVVTYSVANAFGEIVAPATITAKFVNLDGDTIAPDQTIKTDLTRQAASTDALIARGKTVALDVPTLTGYKVQSASTGTLSADRTIDNLPALASTTLTVTFTYTATGGPPYFTSGTSALNLAVGANDGTLSAADLLADVTAVDVDGNDLTASSAAGGPITVSNVSPGGLPLGTTAVGTYIVTYSVTDNHSPDLEDDGTTEGPAKTATLQRVVVIGPDVRKGVV
ncbi:MAG: leucine-rich repeat domain-containing protein, partial [Propionibacteriaceae bacterium]|nr:leucine-rich repeat domain-containing protein [Propionibacteriaceae bacterium]